MTEHSPIIGVGSLQAQSATIQGTGRVIANFAWQHMKSARLFHSHVSKIEAATSGQSFGPFFEDIRSYASASIMAAAAALEALINEFFIDHEGKLRKSFQDFEVEFWGASGVERQSILRKFQTALLRLNEPALDPNDPIFLDADAAIQLRNMLVHYKSTWDPDRKAKADLVNYLDGRFALSPFPDQGADFISMKCMSSGCTAWAIESVVAFVTKFNQRAKLDEKKINAFLHAGA